MLMMGKNLQTSRIWSWNCWFRLSEVLFLLHLQCLLILIQEKDVHGDDYSCRVPKWSHQIFLQTYRSGVWEAEVLWALCFAWWVGWETKRITAINGFAFACRMRSGAALSVGLLDSLIWGALRKCLHKVVQQRWGIKNVIQSEISRVVCHTIGVTISITPKLRKKWCKAISHARLSASDPKA